MTAIISFISASQLGQERLDKDFASTIVDLFYRQHFASTTPVIKSLGSCGGFSGARFWRIEDASHVWCLRRWPQAACEDENRLLWIHRQLALAHAKGCSFLPVPLFSNTRETLVEYGDHLWQMERWMPGTADYHRLPSQARLAALQEFNMKEFNSLIYSLQVLLVIFITPQFQQIHLHQNK